MTNSRMRVAVLMVVIALALGGCSVSHSPSSSSDSAIVSAIQSKLYQDPALKTSNVHVVSQKGVVVLTGNVGSDQEKAAVQQFAQGTDGVKQVINELTVSPAQEASSNAQEAPSQPEHRASRRRSRTVAQREPASEPPAANPEPAQTPAPVEQVPPASQQATNSPPPPPPQPVSVTVPAGTVIVVRTVNSVDSSVNHAGDEIAATVNSPVAENGQLVIPRYAKARLRVVSDQNAGRIRGRSEVQLQLVSLTVGGQTYPVQSGVYQAEAKTSRGKQTAERAGIGAALGGIIGAIAGGGKGAAIGAGVGAGAGTGVQVATKGQPVRIPSESILNFTLRSPLNITVTP